MRYHITISAAMIVALVDLSEDYKGEDSPRWNHGTLHALERRGLIKILNEGQKSEKAKVTEKGEAYLEMCVWEYQHVQKLLGAGSEKKKAA